MTNGTWTSINESNATRTQKDALVRACKISVIHAIKNGWNVTVTIKDANNAIAGIFTKEKMGMTVPAGRVFIGPRGAIQVNEITV
jgi:hypothetical protein